MLQSVGGKQFVRSTEVVRFSCPLSEVPLYCGGGGGGGGGETLNCLGWHSKPVQSCIHYTVCSISLTTKEAQLNHSNP